jgi:endonuclease III
MNKKERALLIEKILDQEIPHPKIPLYSTNTYTLLLAILLSAHSTDKTVNRITPSLFEKADSAQKMLRLSIEEIKAIIRPCGLSQRKATFIYQLSEILVKKYKGIVPKTLKKLEELPGVGHKTASVLLVTAFHEPAFPVDTHIHRCAKRWRLSKGKNRQQTERDLKKLFPKEKWGKIHLQMILYARKFCPALRHRIEHCPLCHQLRDR